MAALFLGAAAIALSPIWVRLSELDPTVSAFYRVFLSLPLLAIYAYGFARGSAWRAIRSRPGIRNLSLAAGLLFAGDLATWHWSIHYTTVANATLFANFAPLFVTLVTWLIYRSRVTALFLIGMATALTGAMVLVGFNLVFAPDRLIGDGLGMLTAVFYAGYMLVVARAMESLDVPTLLLISSAVTALALFPLALLTGQPMVPDTIDGWLILIGLAWFSHAIGQGLIAYALAHLPTTFSSVGLLSQPLLAALLAWWLFAEAIGPWQGLGGAVIVLGIIIAKRGSTTHDPQ